VNIPYFDASVMASCDNFVGIRIEARCKDFASVTGECMLSAIQRNVDLLMNILGWHPLP